MLIENSKYILIVGLTLVLMECSPNMSSNTSDYSIIHILYNININLPLINLTITYL